jgi:hypothetical protein
MNGMFFAESAVLLQLDPVGSVLLVLCRVVIALFALGARQSYFLVLFVVSHTAYLPFRLFRRFCIQKNDTPL